MNIQLSRSPFWRWSVCVVLLFATLLMYMDRLTVAQLSQEIIAEFGLSETQFMGLDTAFSLGFALGALVAGFAADRWNIWWFYPFLVFAWSLAGAVTGLVTAGSYVGLLACRGGLGLAEAGHWPCALRTSQRLFPPETRTLANSILQSGAAIGAILTPLAILLLRLWTDSWRIPFLVIGSLGFFWIVVWFALVRPRDMVPENPATAGLWDGLWDQFLKPLLTDRRFYVLLIFAICINNTWHFFRAGLSRILYKTYHFESQDVQWFTSGFNVSADLGSLAVGFGSVWLVRRGFSVHASRLAVLTVCAFITTASFAVIVLPPGWLAQTAMLAVGFGSLGLFPPYYSLTQEITSQHQGKVSGLFGFLIWLVMGPQRLLEGAFADESDNYHFGLLVAGISPLVGVLVLWLFWQRPLVSGSPPPTIK